MTLTHAGPTPAPPSTKPAATAHHCAGKRFTVRDGFHLKTRNAEAQAVIDAQLSSREDAPETTEDPENGEALPGPSKEEIPSKLSSSRQATTTNNNHLDHDAERGGEEQTSAAMAVLDQLHGDITKCSRGKVRAALQAPSKWLIYRHRPSETLHRKQLKADKLLHEMLQAPQEQIQLDVKPDEVRAPRRPRCQSTLGSTYSERVAAARPAKRPSHDLKQHYQRMQLQPLTETERGLLRSREDNNRAVDKLLVSLFHPSNTPSTSVGAPTPFAPAVKPTTPSTKYSTRRSVIRHETAVALRSRNLVSRMNELRSLPQLLEQMESLQLWKKQQHILEHGVDLVARNRANANMAVVQKPSQTPLLPSATDHKIHQASKRKQEFDAAQEERVRRIVVRWQTRREQRAEEQRRTHIQSQWLLLVTIAESSKNWLTRFHEFRQKRSALVRISMARRLQRYWRLRIMAKRNLLSFAASTPLSSAFFRMPVVVQSVIKLQQSIRKWVARKHHNDKSEAVALIVTAWFEFQDVKFRRIILRFRKRVRDFQVMWRAWRSITAARIKLLLLVWAKLERKIKRRHGIAAAHSLVSLDPSMVTDVLHMNSGDEGDVRGVTVLDMLQRTAAERPLSQQQKQLEYMHRHFRNGGAVHMPINAVSPSSLSSSTSPTVSFQPSPPAPRRLKGPENAHVQQDLHLKHSMGEEFQLVMYDVYTTRRNLSEVTSPSRPVHGVASSIAFQNLPIKSPKSPRPNSLQQQQLAAPLSATNVPVPPATKNVPHQLKVALLRKLLSDKRKQYSDDRDRGREAWNAARKQMRTEAFRYDVLDEMEAFQQLQAKYATFLLLHSISETEIVRLILHAQGNVNAESKH